MKNLSFIHLDLEIFHSKKEGVTRNGHYDIVFSACTCVSVMSCFCLFFLLPAPGRSPCPTPTFTTPLAGTRPPNHRASSASTRDGFLGANNGLHSARDSPPNSAHSEDGSVRRASTGSAGPRASSHTERACGPRTASASTGPILGTVVAAVPVLVVLLVVLVLVVVGVGVWAWAAGI